MIIFHYYYVHVCSTGIAAHVLLGLIIHFTAVDIDDNSQCNFFVEIQQTHISAKEQGTRCASECQKKGRVPCMSPAGAPLLTSLCEMSHSSTSLSSALVVRRDVHST